MWDTGCAAVHITVNIHFLYIIHADLLFDGKLLGPVCASSCSHTHREWEKIFLL